MTQTIARPRRKSIRRSLVVGFRVTALMLPDKWQDPH